MKSAELLKLRPPAPQRCLLLEEAIEVGLTHVYREAQSDDGVSQVILIGDAPANTKQMVIDKRKERKAGISGSAAADS